MDTVNELFCRGGVDLHRHVKVSWCDAVLRLRGPPSASRLQGHTLFWTGLPEGSFFLFLVLCSLSPYIAMSSVSDYKVSRAGREEKCWGLSHYVLNAMGFLTGKHCNVFDSDNAVQYYFYQVRRVTSKSTKRLLLQKDRKRVTVWWALKLI